MEGGGDSHLDRMYVSGGEEGMEGREEGGRELRFLCMLVWDCKWFQFPQREVVCDDLRGFMLTCTTFISIS